MSYEQPHFIGQENDAQKVNNELGSGRSETAEPIPWPALSPASPGHIGCKWIYPPPSELKASVLFQAACSGCMLWTGEEHAEAGPLPSLASTVTHKP